MRRLGLLVFGTDTGLGTLTRSLYHHLCPAKTMLVDLSPLRPLAVHSDWYKYDVRTNGYPSKDDIDTFLDDLDVVFISETPLNYYLIEEASRRGVSTIIQPMAEGCPYFSHHQLPMPTLFALPTPWLRDRYEALPGANIIDLPVPIDTTILPQRTIAEAKTFFHITGRPSPYDRNGTLDFIAVVKQVQNSIDAEFILYCQAPTPEILKAQEGSRIRAVSHVPECGDLYREGDILILPRRYGGLCLPCQEAVGSGIPVLMPDVSPNNDWLPDSWLIPTTGQVQVFGSFTLIDIHNVNVAVLADRMIELYRNPDKVAAMVAEAQQLRKARSWEALKPVYQELIHG